MNSHVGEGNWTWVMEEQPVLLNTWTIFPALLLTSLNNQNLMAQIRRLTYIQCKTKTEYILTLPVIPLVFLCFAWGFSPVHIEVRDQLWGSFLSLYHVDFEDWAHQTWQRAPLTAELSLWLAFSFYIPESNVGYHVTLVSCVVSSFQSMTVFQSFLIVPDFDTSYSIERPSLYIWVSGVFLCVGWHCAFLTKTTELICPSHNIREVKWCH